MLARKFKIGDKQQISFLLKKGYSVSSRLVRFKYRPNNLNFSRFSLVVGKRVGQKAVARNRIRRHVYKAIDCSWNLLPKTCYDVVVLLSPIVSKADYGAIERDIISTINKLRCK